MGANGIGQPDVPVGIVETRYYPFIDGLRGLAILMVVVFHAASTLPSPLPNAGLFRVLMAGERGVQLFFIVSAFTLFSTSLQRFPKEQRPLRNFYVRRAFRILPIWWLALLYYFYFPIRVAAGQPEIPSLGPLLLRASFLSGFIPSLTQTNLNPGGWSLFVEETFYLFLPLIVAQIRSINRAVLFLLVLIATSIGWHFLGMAWLGDTASGSAFVAWFPLFHWYTFGLGIVFYFTISKTGRFSIGPLIWCLDLVAILFFLVASQVSSAGLAFYGLSFALGLASLATSGAGSLWRLALDNPPMRLLGRCSYSIYLFHFGIRDILHGPVLHLLDVLKLMTHPTLAAALWSAALVAVSLLFGVLSFNLLERPLVRLGKRVIAHSEQPARARRSGVELMP